MHSSSASKRKRAPHGGGGTGGRARRWSRSRLPNPFQRQLAATTIQRGSAMEEVEIIETVLVYPSPSPFPGPRGDGYASLPLSHIDTDRNLHVTVRTLRAYAGSIRSPSPGPPPAPPPPDPYHVITEALSKALFHYYPVVGTLFRRDPDARLEVRCAEGQGVPVTRALSPRTLPSLGYLDDPVSPFLDRLVPDPVSGEELEHPLAVQVTRFACGGFSLGVCFHHAMCDGAGATLFLRAVAEIARGAAAPGVEPVWDRAALLGPREPPRVDVDFTQFLGTRGELSDPYEGEDGEGGAISRECFHISETCVERFKARLLEESGSSSFTTFEALGAFIWRARVKAYGVPSGAKVKFAYSMNVRKLLKPALPAGYWGNGCVPVYVQMSAGDLVERTLWETAELIKRSKRGVTEEYVRSFVDFQELHYAEGISAGEGVSGFTDWRHLGHSAVDFGWGGPVTVLPLSFKLLGSREPCFFLPYAAVGGVKVDGFKALVSLPTDAMPAFRVEMEMFSGRGDL
uniref:3'-N-debenzoyl-2'-deoxytaxol N-benzoyltransferase n=1 Tax=Anthurium amnicola TaxID=1678845 RepID=A0A1D1XP63_9ARAE